MSKTNKVKESNKIFAIISSVVLSCVSLLYLGCLFWALISACKHSLDFGYHPFGFPRAQYGGWHLENFSYAYQLLYVELVSPTHIDYVRTPMLFLNSMFYAVGSSLSAVFWTAVTAYVCSKFDYKICHFIYAMVIIVMVLPIVGSLPSEMQICRSLGLYDNIFGLIIMRSHFTNVNFLVFYGVFKAMPLTYNEAAKLDGAGEWSIFFKIILPLASATMFAVFILQFIAHWNDYSLPMLYLPSHPVLAYGLYLFQNSRSNYATEPVKLAASMICCIPSLLIFFTFRKRIMSNISFGGLKG